uniref:Uncharacterized protein n=1 Tax=Solanum tuberosum TaxID=4113 RepID=M1DLY6_SOLTU
MKISESPNPFGKSPTNHIFSSCSSVLSPEGKDQVGGKREQSAHRREVPRSSTMSPNDPKHDDVKVWKLNEKYRLANGRPGPVKLGETSEKSVNYQQVRRSGLMSPNGQKLDRLSAKEYGSWSNLCYLCFNCAFGVRTADFEKLGQKYARWVIRRAMTSSPNHSAVRLSIPSPPYYHALFDMAAETFGEKHRIAKCTRRLVECHLNSPLSAPLTLPHCDLRWTYRGSPKVFGDHYKKNSL